MLEYRQEKSNKRILILANNDVGLYRFRKELLVELLATGYEVYISLPQGEYIEKLKELGCIYIETPFERRGMNPIKDILLLIKYYNLVKRMKPAVVLTYTIKPNVYGGMVCKLLKIPYLSNITGLGTSIEKNGFMQKVILQMYRFGLNKADCIFYQNVHNMKFMKKHHVEAKREKLLPGSGIDLITNPYEEYPTENSEIKFLSVMRIMKDKGICELLECAKTIKKQYTKVRFSLVGEYDEEYLKEQVEKAQREGIIEYLGFRNDIHELMANHHCIIHPSYHEGMSNILLEAAACGRPVIASDIPGCAEVFEHRKTGYGFTVKNVDEMIKCVQEFIEMPIEQKAQMGRNGRSKVEKEFDRKIVIDSYIQEINKIINKG